MRCSGRHCDTAFTKYGIDTDDQSAMQADMTYLRKSRAGSDEAIKWKNVAHQLLLSSALVPCGRRKTSRFCFERRAVSKLQGGSYFGCMNFYFYANPLR